MEIYQEIIHNHSKIIIKRQYKKQKLKNILLVK
jgi:hypothetical protein